MTSEKTRAPSPCAFAAVQQQVCATHPEQRHGDRPDRTWPDSVGHPGRLRPVFMLIRGMGLSDTLLALILPAIPTAFGTFLMRQYFLGLPNDFAEAAALDGAGPWRIFRSVYVPLAVPGMAIVGILAFNFHWNEFFRPLVLTISEQNFTLPSAWSRSRATSPPAASRWASPA